MLRNAMQEDRKRRRASEHPLPNGCFRALTQVAKGAEEALRLRGLWQARQGLAGELLPWKVLAESRRKT